MHNIKSVRWGNAFAKTGATLYYAQWGLSYEVSATQEFAIIWSRALWPVISGISVLLSTVSWSMNRMNALLMKA